MAGIDQHSAADKRSSSSSGASVVEATGFPTLLHATGSDPPTGRGKGQGARPADSSHVRIQADVVEIETEQDTRTDSYPTRDPRREVTPAVPLLLQEGDYVGVWGSSQEAKELLVSEEYPSLV